jgi:hypothetical protein
MGEFDIPLRPRKEELELPKLSTELRPISIPKVKVEILDIPLRPRIELPKPPELSTELLEKPKTELDPKIKELAEKMFELDPKIKELAEKMLKR